MSKITIDIKQAGYGKKVVLPELTLTFDSGSITGIIGPNGAGKSTLLKAMMGLIDCQYRKLTLSDEDISNIRVDQIVKKGLRYVPQGHRVFDELTVMENLEIGGYLLTKNLLRTGIEEILPFFPDIQTRLKYNAGSLSGGEKQELALAMALMTKPGVLLLDEPSLGLSPSLVDKIFRKLVEIREKLGTTLIIVEQKVHEIRRIADQIRAFRMGEVVFSGKPVDLNDQLLKSIFLVKE